MWRKVLILLMCLTLSWTTAACGGSSTAIQSEQPNFNNNVSSAPTSISDGKYPVQQATYNDVDGEYNLMLLNTPPGTPPVFRSANLQMARLSDEAIQNGEKTYLQVENGQPIMYLTEDFRIEYVHNVTETRTDPATGEPQTVIVRRESNFWTPFAGALAGQALGSLLFRPQYYVPPVYQPGGVLTGFGGYGSSYTQAVNNYQERYNEPPAVVKNRQTLRTTGSIRNSSKTSTRNTLTKPNSGNTRATGSGFGSSDLRSSSKSKYKQSQPSKSFGSGFGSRRPTASFGSRRRR
jgi:hypothetical protein